MRPTPKLAASLSQDIRARSGETLGAEMYNPSFLAELSDRFWRTCEEQPMNVFDIFDENTRPKAPPIPGATPAHRMAGRKLEMIHGMHLSALDETAAMMERVVVGESQVGDLATQINSMRLMSNYRQFGNLCGRECRFLEFHHMSEDNEIFPVIYANGGDGLKRVIARLTEEHLLVHELLESLATNVSDLLAQPGPDTFARTQETFTLLSRLVRSHFDYEQTELEEALGFYAVPF